MKTALLICIYLLCLSVGAWANGPRPANQNYEYKFEYQCNEKKANQLGDQGWELAAMDQGTGLFSTCAFRRGK